MRLLFFFLLLTTCRLQTAAQAQCDISTVLSGLSCPSAQVTTDSSVIPLLAKGDTLLSLLAEHFTDYSVSRVYSACTKRFLTRGELAMILADKIEGMPYYLLTGFENCLLDQCPDNPNRVEYYLPYIRSRGITRLLQQRYREWLAGPERRKYRKAANR